MSQDLFVIRTPETPEAQVCFAPGENKSTAIDLAQSLQGSVQNTLLTAQQETGIEKLQQQTIYDQSGKAICQAFLSPQDGGIYEIHTTPYENEAQLAENTEEEVCGIKDGKLIETSLTRGEVRAENIEYLVCTAMVWHNGEVLLQQRSDQKKIDPGRWSTSAHGVGTTGYLESGTQITEINHLALINTAVEINEELRHGKETQPFKIKIWYGDHRSLSEFASKNKIDDPNTIYLIGQGLYNDNCYPLGAEGSPRTRALSDGFIFSKEPPHISIDPAEVAQSQWIRPSKIPQDLDQSDDLVKSINHLTEVAIHRDPELSAASLKRRLLAKL